MSYLTALYQRDEKEALICRINISRITLEVVSVGEDFLSKPSEQELIVEINLGLLYLIL